MTKALYRKLNDGSHSSSTYHKRDGTPIRQILKRDLKKEITGSRAPKKKSLE